MPLYERTCPGCKLKTEERLYRSFEEAASARVPCSDCGEPTEVDIAISFSFSAFKPFTTEAFNKRPGQTPMEITDRSQLRGLLRSNRMVEQGDSSNYFGSNPKSVPTWKEICKFGKSGGDPKLAKLVKTGTVKDMQKIDAAADETNFGRRTAKTRREFSLTPH